MEINKRKDLKNKYLKKNNIKTYKFLLLNHDNYWLTPSLTFIKDNLKDQNYKIIIKRMFEIKAELLNDFDYVKVLYMISKFYNNRLRNINDFDKFKSRNREKQIYEIIDYLYVKYDVPLFLKNIFITNIPHFNYNPPGLELFFYLTNGNNVRKWDKRPFDLTKKEAHYYLLAPKIYSYDNAFYFAKLYSKVNNIKAIDILVNTKITEYPDYNLDFWLSVISVLSKTPMLDINMYPVIIDYINEMKFNLKFVKQDGKVEIIHPIKENFDIKNRNINNLINDVEDWHNKLKKIKINKNSNWDPIFIQDFEHTSGKSLNQKIFKITQILDSKSLLKEGNQLNHCVFSYRQSCVKNRIGIFSYTVNGKKTLTIEVNNTNKNIVQIRGYSNRIPNSKEEFIIKMWCKENNITYRKNIFDY